MDSDEDEYMEKDVSVPAMDNGMSHRTRKQSTNKDVLMMLQDSDDADDDEDEEENDDDIVVDDTNRRKRPAGAGGPKSKRKKQGPMINEQLKGVNGGYAWEDEIKRSWDIVKEDKDGSLKGLVSGLVEANKMKKISKDVTPFQRGIIRTLILVIDCSQAMSEKDLRPNRYSLTITYALEFVTEFFDQNPISQLGIVAMRNGVAQVVSDVSGNPVDHINSLRMFKRHEPKGDPSLQNALEMARGLLLHTSPHSTKEVLILFGTLFTSDPGDIFKTINHLVHEKIRVRIIGLNAQVSICSKIVSRTNFGDEKTNYGIVMNEQHFKDLLNDCITPLPVIKQNKQLEDAETESSGGKQPTKYFNLIKMGFPKRITEEDPSFCSCHSNLNYGGYICPFCKAKLCSLPAICPTCNLMLISSTHLARSYHHLFPLKNYREVLLNGKLKVISRTVEPVPENGSANAKAKAKALAKEWADADAKMNELPDSPFVVSFGTNQCYSCQVEFPVKSGDLVDPKVAKTSGRYACPDCKEIFCIDCNVFIHEALHNCPGCESRL